jgi:hypothetical protein
MHKSRRILHSELRMRKNLISTVLCIISHLGNGRVKAEGKGTKFTLFKLTEDETLGLVPAFSNGPSKGLQMRSVSPFSHRLLA